MPLCYSCCGVIWLMPTGLFLGLLHVLLSIGYSDLVWSLNLYLCYLGFSWPITLLVGLFDPFLSPWASSAHFLILHSHGLLLTPLDFPNPITIFFILKAHGLLINPLLSYFITLNLLWLILTFLHHIMPMGLLLLSLGSFRPICFPQNPFTYFMGIWFIIPAIQA